MSPILFALPGNEALADRLQQALGWERGAATMRRFPDGESYLRYHTAVDGRDLVLVCTLDRPDEKLAMLFLAASVARELGARRIGLVAPYLAYMRQDAVFHPGEGITSRHVARWLASFADWLVTVDPHLHRIASLDEIYPIPSRVVQAAPAIAQWVAANVRRPVIVGPDGESEQWVAAVARAAGCGHTVLHKVRHGDRDVEQSLPDAPQWVGETPVLVDDIASTGRTMIGAAAILRDAGLPPPVCIAVHALFADDACASLRAAGVADIVTCDTVPHPTNRIGLAYAIAEAARELAAAPH